MTIERNCKCGATFTCTGDACTIRYKIRECLCSECLLDYAKNNKHTLGAIPKVLNQCFSGFESDTITNLVRLSTGSPIK